MGFYDDVKQAAAPKGNSCAVALWLQTVPEDVAAEFGKVIEDVTIPATVIHGVMAEKHNFQSGTSSVQRHRRHGCQCS